MANYINRNIKLTGSCQKYQIIWDSMQKLWNHQWTIPKCSVPPQKVLKGSYPRLLDSPILVISGMSVGYETQDQICWHHPFVIGWSKNKLGLAQSLWIVGLHELVGILCRFRGHWQSPCTALTAGICLPLVLCKEAVKESMGYPDSFTN